MNESNKPRTLGLTGTLIGLLALGLAVFHFFVGPLETPPPLESVVADQTVKIKQAITAKIKGTEHPAEPVARTVGADDMIFYAVIALGFAALTAGVLGFVQREDLRSTGAAVVLGSGAIAFQFAVVVVGAVLGAILIGFIILAVMQGL